MTKNADTCFKRLANLDQPIVNHDPKFNTAPRVVGRRGAPTRIRSDNGSEFICEVLVGWLLGTGTEPFPVAPASPWENGYIESFHSRLRDEFLERVEFENVEDARAKDSWYRREYNAVRPHSSLSYATPKEFSAACDRKGKRQMVVA
jgi:transposase InsO family protein